MKTISLAILAALALGSCTKDDTAPVQSAKDNRTLSVVATTESASRAVLYEGESAAQVVWEADDKIGVFTMSNKATAPNNCLHIVQGGSTTARFAGQMQNEVQHNDSYFAYYPYDGRTEFYYDSDQSIVLNAPRVQYRRSEGFDARSCGFMVAKSKTGILYGDEPEFAFKNLFAILKFTLTGAGERLYRINVFDNNGGQMSGQFFVSMTDANLADPTPTFEGGGFYTARSTRSTLRSNATLYSPTLRNRSMSPYRHATTPTAIRSSSRPRRARCSAPTAHSRAKRSNATRFTATRRKNSLPTTTSRSALRQTICGRAVQIRSRISPCDTARQVPI